jgi:hypothetical protein
MAAVVYHNFQMGSAQVSFSVLVWGPSKSSDDRFFEKRKQVKESIENNGHKAFFSEELTFDEQYTVPVNVQERAQLEMIDLVVCLGTDFGAMQEAQEFADERPQHFLLWLSSQGKGTYSDKGIGEVLRLAGTPPIFFGDPDLESCIIATTSADWVERWRYRKWAIDNERRRLDETDPTSRRKK